MFLHPNRWPLHYQNTVLAVLVIVPAVCATGWMMSGRAAESILSHEKVDLKDETQLQALLLQSELRRVAIEFGKLRQENVNKDLQVKLTEGWLNGRPAQSELYSWGPGPPMPPLISIREDSHFLSSDLKPVKKQLHREEDHVSGTQIKFVDNRCHVYLGRQLQSDKDWQYVDVDITSFLEDLSVRSPRHQYCLISQGGQYFYHPSRTGLNVDIAKDHIEKIQHRKPILLDKDAHFDSAKFYYRKWQISDPNDFKEFNSFCADFAKQHKWFRFSELTDKSKHIEISDPDPKVLDIAIEELSKSEKLSKLSENSKSTEPVFCKSFIGSVISLDTGLDEMNVKDAPWLVMIASTEEIKNDIWVESRIWFRSVLVSVAILAAVIALMMTWYVTRPIRKIRTAAMSLAKAAGRFEETEALAGGSGIHLAVTPLPDRGPREVLQLAEAFQTMVLELGRMTSRFVHRSAELRAVLDNASDAVVLFNQAGFVERVNPAAEAMFGCSREVFEGRQISEFLRPISGTTPLVPAPLHYESSQTDEASVDYSRGSKWQPNFVTSTGVKLRGFRKSQGTGPVSTLSAFAAAGREKFWAAGSFSEVQLSGRLIYIGIVRDISNDIEESEKLELMVRERTEELRAANDQLSIALKTKDVFMASISHELRQPLNVISGDSQLLLRMQLAPEVRKRVERIRSAQQLQTALVNDILDYIKIIEDKLDLRPGAVDLDCLLRDTADEMRPQVEGSGNQLVLDLQPIGVALVDTVRLKQILYNLIGNAAKFTRDGVVQMSAARRGHERFEVAVTDTGRGLRAEDYSLLFQPFGKLRDQGHNSEGTGLGLAICRGLCSRMGGYISVESSGLGLGSTFTLNLPATAPDASATAGIVAASAVPTTPPDNPRLLVVDDDPLALEVLKTHLEDRGWAVTAVSSGGAALDVVKSVRPAVVLLDILMPNGVNGWGVLAALKTDPETALIPVVMVSMLDDRTRGSHLGASDYIVKPIQDWDGIVDRIRRLRPVHRRALVVDDDPEIRRGCRDRLESGGWQVQEAETGTDALALIATDPPAVIVLDLLLPEMDGFQVLDRLRSTPSWAEIPVIALAPDGMTADEQGRLAASVRDVLRTGGVEPARLFDQLQVLIERHVR